MLIHTTTVLKYENRTVLFAFFFSRKDVSKLASSARPFAAVIRQRLIVLSNVLDFVLRYELEENVLVSRKTANVDKYIDLTSIAG